MEKKKDKNWREIYQKILFLLFYMFMTKIVLNTGKGGVFENNALNIIMDFIIVTSVVAMISYIFKRGEYKENTEDDNYLE